MKKLSKKQIIIIIVSVILVLSLIGAIADRTKKAESTTNSTEATSIEPTYKTTTEPTTEPTTIPATEPTTIPATEPTTIPATEPTTIPATEPTTIPATEPTTIPATEPTTVPATEPAEQGTKITVENLTTPIDAGKEATLTIKGKPNTEYRISVYYSSGASKADGLENKTTDSNGFLSWTWKVGAKTKSGTYRIVISGDNEKLTTYFKVN